jgi:two-component system phosphate regulon response regulator OmpR
MRVLLVEDDEMIGSSLQQALGRAGWTVDWLRDGEPARAALGDGGYTCVLLDLGLPRLDGLTLLRQLRARGELTPVLVLTARDGVDERILGLDLGADDYLAKPFEPRELLARVKALLRRGQGSAQAAETLRFGRLEIDLGARVARLDGKDCELTSHQFELLVVMARHAGRVMTRDQIMDALKGHPLDAFDRSIDVHISRIRAAIEDDAKAPKRVLTVRGAGYVFARKQDE